MKKIAPRKRWRVVPGEVESCLPVEQKRRLLTDGSMLATSFALAWRSQRAVVEIETVEVESRRDGHGPDAATRRVSELEKHAPRAGGNTNRVTSLSEVILK